MLTPVEFLVVAYLAPLVLLVVYGRIRLLQRRKLLLAAQAEIDRKRAAGLAQDLPPIYFEPKPEPALDWLLRQFDLPHRTELRRQYALARFGFFLVGYVLLVASLAGLLPGPARGFGYQQAVWRDYLHSQQLTNGFAAILSFLTAMIAGAQLQTPQAVFTRTRPLPFAFLYRVRVWFAFAVLLAAVACALLLSNLVLMVAYPTVVRDTPGALRQLLEGDLALLLLCAVLYSVAVLLASLSIMNARPKKGGFLWLPALLGGLFGSQIVHSLRLANTAMHRSAVAGAAPHAIGPVVLLELFAMPAVVVLLYAAERLAARYEP